MTNAGARTSHQLGVPLIALATTTSTMDEVDKRARAGAPEGLAVVAEHQTAGRGRAGREWESRPGSAILCSVLLRPPVQASQLGPLPLVIGLGLAQAIERETDVSPCLKWPNDLIGGRGKIGGVLLTSRLNGSAIDWVTAGFGINVNMEPERLPNDASSLQVEAGQGIDRSRLLGRIFASLERHYRQFVEEPENWDRAGWLERCCLLGEVVTLEEEGIAHTGELKGVDRGGGLQIKGKDGAVRTFLAGDLVRGPRSASRLQP